MTRLSYEDVGAMGDPERQCWHVYFPQIDGGTDYPLVVIERNRTNARCRVVVECWDGPVTIRCVHRAEDYAAARAFLRRTFGKLSPDDALALVEAWRKGNKRQATTYA